MSIVTLVLGESGTGKSASLRNLVPADTLLIQSIRKPLSFKAAGWGYRTNDNPAGNIFVTDKTPDMITLMQKTQRKIIALDDFQYVMANEYMRRSSEKGFDKFTDIGTSVWNLFSEAALLPADVRVYLLSHTQTDDAGRTKIKTIGKMLDEKITLEGMVTICLKTLVQGGEYTFATRNNGSDTVKTPMGMFDADHISNDLKIVDDAICSYFELTTPQQ